MVTDLRQLAVKVIADSVRRLLLSAVLCPGEDVLSALTRAAETEKSPVGRRILESLRENAEIAKGTGMAYCQDTGMVVIFLEIGQEVMIEGDIEGEINRAVAAAYSEGYFRKSVLDPLSRVNTGDNAPAVIHYLIVPGNHVKVSVAPKGFGSENMSFIKMLNPSDGVEGIKKAIIEGALSAGGSPCPPVVLGIGIGGTMEKCALMSKHALLRELDTKNPDPVLHALEEELKVRLNALGLGPMAVGGSTYCLGVHIESYPTHIAALPLAVNFQCHACRHQSEVI